MRPPPRNRSESHVLASRRAPGTACLAVVHLALWILSSESVGLLPRQILKLHEPTLETFLASHLFHDSALNLGLNLAVLLLVGGTLELRWGMVRFFGFYILCAWGATTVSILAGALAPATAGSCGASGVALACLIALGLCAPERRLLRALPPARQLVWVGVLLVILCMVMLYDRDAARPLFLLPQISGLVFGLLFLSAEPVLEQQVARWRLRREAERRGQVFHMRRRVDELLDKISAAGTDSLSREEKTFLRRASRHYRQD